MQIENTELGERTNIEKNVMRRVRIISVVRPIISSGVLAMLVFVFTLWGIGREVWVAQVFANGPQDFSGHFSYLLYAFNHTELAVQGLALLSVISLIYIARATARAFASFVIPAHA